MRVLIADDERISRVTTARQLQLEGMEVETAESAAAAIEILHQAPWDVLLTDLRMPGMDGMELLQRVRAHHPEVDVILMTAFGSVETAVQAMQLGAVDYLIKPFPFAELHARLQRIAAVRAVKDELARLRQLVEVDPRSDNLIGASPAMHQLRDRIGLFAAHDAPVLVTGETGTGKEVVARALHRASPRAQRPFVALACGAIPKDLAESELFGHERGAFTGALKRREGVFEQADGGTLLLDDIDDLPLDLQVKLLRVLQEGTLTRVGGSAEVHVQVRVVATSKLDLREAAERGQFRQDVYYRLRGLELRLPPLRDRGNDVLLLAQHFLRSLGRQPQGPTVLLSPAVSRLLLQHHWPGNVRELRRLLEAALVLCRGDELLPEHLPAELQESAPHAGRRFSLHLDGAEELPMPKLVQDFEDALLDWAMAKAGGQQGRAAELLGIARTTLQSKLTKRRG